MSALLLFVAGALFVAWRIHVRRRYDLVADACAEAIYQAGRRRR